MEFLVSLLFPLVPIASVWAIVRHGPIENRWWRGERPVGFALFVGGIAFLAGFVGPMIVTPGANQGPLLGIFITGPIGLVVGLLWGLWRAARRAGEG
ncbi:MAG TPA: hypothetical protein VLV16_05475 [Gemmatimonadales bacterium]|nr:hypothetical protein [Gemmatimonadales bacterium]